MAANEEFFLVKDGKLVIEAESASPVGDWKSVTIDGEKSLLWDAAKSSYGKVPEGETLSYYFRTDESGDYSIGLHSGRDKDSMNSSDLYHNGKSGSQRTDTGNDVYVAIVEVETGEVVQKPTKLFTGLGSTDNDLRWGSTFDANHKKSEAKVSLDANTDYRLEIIGRSDGYVLDRITLSNDGVLRDTNSPESPTTNKVVDTDNGDSTPDDNDNGSGGSDDFVAYKNDALVAKADHIVFHFDGNINDPDDIAAVPVAAALIKAAGLEDKTTFFINNNLMEGSSKSKYDGAQADKMRDSAAFAESLGIKVYDHMKDGDAAVEAMADIFNTGDDVVSFEGGPMEAVYRALDETNSANLDNITLVSHSSWNENRDVVSRSDEQGNKARTWDDIADDFKAVNLIEIADQNDGNNNNKGFNNENWTKLLNETNDPVLKAMQDVMIPAGNTKKNDPSDAGMLFYGLTGIERGTPQDAMDYLLASPNLAFDGDQPDDGDTGNGGGSGGGNDTPPQDDGGSDDVSIDLKIVEAGKNGDELYDISEGGAPSTITLDEGVDGLKKVSVVAALDSSEKNMVDKVTFSLQGVDENGDKIQFSSWKGTQTEKVYPYTLFGDINGDLYGKELPVGTYQITAKAYSSSNALLDSVSTSFEIETGVVDSGDPGGTPEPNDDPVDQGDDGSSGGDPDDNSDTPDPVDNGDAGTWVVAGPDSATGTVGRVSKFTLIDADQDVELGAMTDGMVINKALLDGGKASFALWEDDFADQYASRVESVRFNLNDGAYTRTENVEPYVLFGDNMKGDYFEKSGLRDGTNEIDFTLYSKDKAKGDVLDKMSVEFDIESQTDRGLSIITGTDNDDMLAGTVGNDLFVGSKGLDTLYLDGGADDYDVSVNGNGEIVLAHGNQTDYAIGMDLVVFGDDQNGKAQTFAEAFDELTTDDSLVG